METPRAGDERHDSDNDVANQRDDDRREALLDQREAELDAREARADARDAAHAARIERVLHILTDADKRDDQAEARDSAAATRDTAAGLQSFTRPMRPALGCGGCASIPGRACWSTTTPSTRT